MTFIRQKDRPIPDFWHIHGHSWFQFQTGPSGDQTGRVDSLFRAALDIEYTGWRNRAVSGAKIATPGRAQGGWTRAIAARGLVGRTAPYAPDAGATVLCWAWNDAAALGFQNTAARKAVVDTHRAVISRCRASVVHEDSDATRHTYGANWANSASGLDLCSGGTTRLNTTAGASAGAADRITYTIPADYTGETIAFAFLLRPGATGGTVTFGGTAGVTGTFYTGGGGQSVIDHAYTVKRITTLTSANAGQTITMEKSQLDASGAIFYDCAWLETKTPGPVLVCNLHKSITGSNYGYWNAFSTAWSSSGTRTETQMDADVDLYNAELAAMVQEFDGMVQIANMDAAINPGGVKGSLTRTSDGIHPNEYGAGAIVDELMAAKNRCTPPAGNWGTTLSFNPPSPRAGALQYPRPIAYPFQTPLVFNPTYSATAPPASGVMWAFPFIITGARETYMNLALEVVAAGTVSPTIRWGLYDDVDQIGYPQQQVPSTDTTSGAAFSVPLAAGVQQSTAMVAGFGFVADPGLYWVVIKVDAAGTGQTWRQVAGNTLHVPSRVVAGTAPASYVGLQLTGQGTAALASTFPTGAVPAAGPAPALMLRRTK